jgi:NAD+ diphosphatase
MDDAWLDDAWNERGQVLLLDREYRVLVRDSAAGDDLAGSDGAPGLALLPGQGRRPADAVLLGEDIHAVYFARSVEALPEAPEARPAVLREVGSDLGDRDAGLLVHAVALLTWLDRSPHCPRCGAPTEIRAAGSLRVCTNDGSEHHPRTDPAMIVLVTSADGEHAVLGRNVGWPEGLYSCLAGFVEPGESAEQSVHREVAEEVGLAVSDVRYTGSQPWPFPSSLMLAFTAVAEVGELRPDPEEIGDARWFRRDELRAALADGSVWAPPAVSIARRMIDGWLAG